MKSSKSGYTFSQIPKVQIPRSQFNRSHGYKTTFDSGKLIPIYCDEALPGDTFNLHLTTFARLATPIVPFMDNMTIDTHFFAVPNRLLWENWEKFNGQQDDPGDSTDYLAPMMTSPTGGYENQSISDYFGIPTKIEGIEHSSLFHRAYNLIYNTWYKDQNLQDNLDIDKSDGPDDPSKYEIKRRGKRHDYFTSALPWPQKGPAVDIPLGTAAPIAQDIGIGGELSIYDTATSAYVPMSSNLANVGVANASSSEDNRLYADLSEATAATINSLRQAFQIQKLYEKDARGGTRYTEVIQSHFGVTSDDARLQRPEYLGGGSAPMNVNPIAQTSQTDSGTPQGNLAAFATSSMSKHGFTKSFTEHCVIIGIASVRCDLNYQQGLNKKFSRKTRFDYYWPSLSHLGEQAILNKEIFAQGTAEDENVFGYQERYAEYRYSPSEITGKFRSNDDQSLDYWHLAQDFATLPTLSSDFIEEDAPVDRVIATTDEPQIIFDSYFSIKTARPMPTYSVPGLIDHF